MTSDEAKALEERTRALRCHGTCNDTEHRMIDALVETIDAEREKVARLERERDELAAQLAVLREAVLIHQSTAHLWDREVSSAEEFAESMGTLIDADSRLCEALAASAPDAEAYTRRVQADALESAADAMRADTSLPFDTRDGRDWLRARAAELRGGR